MVDKVNTLIWPNDYFDDGAGEDIVIAQKVITIGKLFVWFAPGGEDICLRMKLAS
jgi:hypothetical protein